MSRIFFSSLLTGVALLSLNVAAEAQSTSSQRIIVPAPASTSKPSTSPGYSFFNLSERDAAQSSSDGGGYLDNVIGISSSRLGGHGTDPVIRGQQQTQLNIISDGTVVHGGCPSRMDPPTSFIDPENFDSVTILKGYQSVRYGAGGTGGTILFDRKAPSFENESINILGNVSGHYESNGQIRGMNADASMGNNLGQIRGIWSTASGNNYKDGNGDSVRTSFSSENFSLLPVWTPTIDTSIKGGIDITRTADVLYAGMMDSPKGSNITQRLSVTHKMHGDILKFLDINAYNSTVDHTMDNYTLRTNTGMKRRTPSESDTFGGYVSADLVAGHFPLTIGLDLQNNSRDAWSYTGTAIQSSANTIASRMWPDVNIRQTGLFAESSPSISPSTRLKMGVRYDYVEAEAKGASTIYGTNSPNSLYLAHYGHTAHDKTEHNFGGLLRLEQNIDESTTFYAGISRSNRTADASERYLAFDNAVASMKRVGNPDIDPEKHHQLDIGVAHQEGRWNTTVSGYIDYISDYILQDIARGQSGTLLSNGATIYRNINAHIMGFEAEGQYQISTPLFILGGFAYTYGNNDTDNDALAQISPFSGKLSLEYRESDWTLGSRVNFATHQSRIDDQTSRRDVRKTGGYGTVDLYGKINFRPFEVRIGVSNIFDKNYSQHLNRSNIFDPTSVQINEAGRSYGIQLRAKF